MKRQFRNDMSDEQKRAISQSLQGRRLTQDHKNKISRSLEKYWSELPVKPCSDTKNNETTMDKIYGND